MSRQQRLARHSFIAEFNQMPSTSLLRRALIGGCCPVAMMAGMTSSGWALENVGTASTEGSATYSADQTLIIVTGTRAIVAALQDVPVEQTYDEDSVASYNVSTTGELLDEIRNENGDSDPAILVNGRPITDPSNISDIPVEAIARVETLPRGSAQRVNGAAGQRTYNIVLRNRVRSATLTASRETATEGGWNNNKGEMLLTYIKGQDRINLTIRGARSGDLFESERDFIPRQESIPYSVWGNITPVSGLEIDPQLSALAGQRINFLALPHGQTSFQLSDLVAGANQLNPSNQSFYRTLRGSSRPIDIAAAGNKELAPWLSLQFSGRVNWTDTENYNGLPSARFLIPTSNAFTPFSTPVYIALNDPDRPLRSASSTKSHSVSAAFNAAWGGWRAILSGRWDYRHLAYRSQLTGSLVGGSTVASTQNPFDGSLAGLIPIGTRSTRSRNSTPQVTLDLDGPLFQNWAGTVRVSAGLGATWINYDAEDSSGERAFSRHEYLAKAGISIPLTSREEGFLPILGDIDLALDAGTVDLGRYGNLKRRGIELDWEMLDWLRFSAGSVRTERAIAPELLAAPEVISPNVPYFDPLTGETVDVTLVYGGAASLRNESLRSRTLALTANPLRKYNFQFDVSYSTDDLRNQLGALPSPSTAIVAAFPDRFQRNASGTLILVDNRSVNFARQQTEQLRFGLRFAIPLTRSTLMPGKTGLASSRRTPPLKLQVTASHSILLKNTTVIREGLPEIDLLKGGAIGIAGGQQRHATNASVALNRGGTGLRFDLRRRGASYLSVGSPTDPDMLSFAPLTTVDFQLYADLAQIFPNGRMAKGAKITVAFDNISNQRQRVTNLLGEIPQAYQPVRRDPIGRTVMIELRKIF
ncbi:hypothetical protein [Sphingobium sp. LB126]|uniref:hypothetical protein n=1 Tax=Sphingobium sp. LB126 TaxID=1983755 RepID=UPI0012FE3EAD|nr:hypothetical protein [Sphingobium sp. LB126]